MTSVANKESPNAGTELKKMPYNYISLTLSFHVSGSISNIDGAEYHCNKTQVRKVISGVVGAASSVTSIQVANLLRLFRIPQVSVVPSS
jgi:hypothetical protein